MGYAALTADDANIDELFNSLQRKIQKAIKATDLDSMKEQQIIELPDEAAH